MKRSYLFLLGIVVVLALVLSAVRRTSRTGADATSAASAPAPAVELALTIRGGTISPSLSRVEKGTRIALTVTNAGATPASLALPGYEDRVGPISLASGESWRGSFLADRPGDDFAWTLDGRPAARLIVEGSHLVEGHR